METTSEAGSVPSSILFQTPDGAVVLLDVPRSLEEGQAPPGQQPLSRISSGSPPAAPYATPEPTKTLVDSHATAQSHEAAIADMMTTAAVQSALRRLAQDYSGPYHLPRSVGSKDSGVVVAHAESGPCRVIEPADARYVCGSIADTRQAFVDTAPTFDLVVLDPPWPNRSARRRRGAHRYATVDGMDEMGELLATIPIAAHISPGGLVAVWITNKPSARRLLTSADGVFAAWGLEFVAEWTWLKIAASGQPLYDVDSQWRKPWESLLIARPRGACPRRDVGPKVLVAVPDLHSRKPNLRPLFRDVLGDGFVGLEVFARNLTSGWWSWGDEVLKFQEAQYWQPTTYDEDETQ